MIIGRMTPGEETAQKQQEAEAAGPFKRILLALDLSERTPDIIRIGSFLARSLQAETAAVYVVKMSTGVRADESDGSPANKNEEDIKESLVHLLKPHYGEGIEHVQVKILHGNPADRIAEYAEYLSSDLIVIGSRGHGALKRAILGSTSSAVASSSKSSVLIIK
ncbi:MAG: universal stress protein [Nitrososphaerales archaeon]